MRIFKCIHSLFLLLFFVIPTLGFSEDHKTAGTPKRAQTSSADKKTELPPEACTEKDFFKYSGQNGLQRTYDPETFEISKEEPPLPLFEQFITTKPNPDYRPPSVGWGTPASALASVSEMRLPSPVLTFFQNRLHARAVENFESLFKHSLNCLQNGKPDFLDALRTTVQDSLYTREEPPQLSDFFSNLFDVAKKEKKTAPEGVSQKLVDTIEAFRIRLENLKALSDYEASTETHKTASLLPIIGSYLSSPSSAEALSELSSKIHEDPTKKEKRDRSHTELLTQLVSNIVSDPGLSAHLRQKVLFGNQPSLFELSPDGTKPSPSQDILGNATQELRGFSQALSQLRQKISEMPAGVSSAKEEALWRDFQRAISEEAQKLTPAERTRIRQSLLDGLQLLDQKQEKTNRGTLKSAENREAMLRTAHALELTVPNPALAALPLEKRQQEESFAQFASTLAEHFQQKAEPASVLARQRSSSAQQQLGMTVPLRSQNAIGQTDPLLLSLTQKSNGSLLDNEQTRLFFQTGHSSALFDLSDSSHGKVVSDKISQALEASGALSAWSSEEKKTLRELLDHSVGNQKRNAVSGWSTQYEQIRGRLLESLTDSTDEKAKATALAIEMIDSTGNHGANPYASPLSDSTKDHYQVRNVLARLREEKALASHSGSHPTQRLRSLLGKETGIPSRARIAELARTTEEGAKKEGSLLELYHHLLTNGGKKPLSRADELVLKRFAFSNPGAEKLVEQINLLIPGFRELELLQGLQEGILPGSFLTTAPKLFEANRELEQRFSGLLESLRSASRSYESDDRASHLGILGYLDELSEQPPLMAADFLTQNFEEGDPRRAQAADLMATLAPLVENNPELARQFEFMNQASQKRNQIIRKAKAGNANYPFDLEEHLPLLGSALDGMARLRATAGSSSESVKPYMDGLSSKFDSAKEGQLEDLISRATSERIVEELAARKSRKQILTQFGPDGVKWDSSIGAFEIGEKTRLSSELLKALEREGANLKFVWRDSRKPQEEEVGTLTELRKRLLHRDQDLTLAGLGPRAGEWFPIEGSDTTAARWVSQNGKLELEFGDLKQLRAKMEERLKSASSLKTDVARAIAEFGSFSHGAKDVLFNPFGLGYDPSQSKEDKALLDSRNRFTQARRELGEFGLLSVNGLTQGRHLLDEFLEFEKVASDNTQNAIQSYVNNAELTGEMVFAAGTLPFSFLGAANAATKLSSASRLGFLLAEGANAARTIGTAARTARNFAALSAGAQTAFSGQSLVMGDAEYRRIQAAVRSGEEWRKHPTRPDPEKYKSQAELERDYLAWAKEQRWDTNRNGKPDFLEEELEEFAFKGDTTAFGVGLGATKTYKNVFGMVLTGQLLPGTSFVGHVAIPSLAEKELRYLTRAGKEGDLFHDVTQLDIAKELGAEVGAMAPAMLLPGAVIRKMPTSLQKPIGLFGIKTTTDLAGASAFVGGSAATHAAINAYHGGNPMDALDPSSLILNAYVGLSISKSAAYHEAQRDILKMPNFPKPPTAGQVQPRLGEPGSSALTTQVSSTQTEKAFWDSLVKKYGKDVVDAAAVTLREAPISEKTNPQIFARAAEYLRGRVSESGQIGQASLQENPFKESSIDQLQTRMQTLQGELSGAKGVSFLVRDPSGFRQKSLEFKQAKAALETKLPQVSLGFAAQQLEVSHALQQMISDGVSRPRSASQWKEIIDSTAPEFQPLVRELSQISLQTIPRTQRWSDGIRSAASQPNLVGDLLSTVINPRALGSSPVQRAETAANILGQTPVRILSGSEGPIIDHYVHARFNHPRILERLASQMGIDSTSFPLENLGPLQVQLAQRTAQQFMHYVRTQKPKPEETIDEVFARFISSQGTKLIGVSK